MIKASDLRIGNWISGQNDPPMKVVSLGRGSVELRFDGVDEDYGDWAYDDDDLRPIPLTPEILEACGFETFKDYDKVFIKKYSNQGQLVIHNGGSPVGKANGLTAADYYYFFDNLVHIIKYFHQLQNLFYLLCGEELTLSLKETIKG